MKRKKKAQSSEEELDEDDKLMIETAKKNENTHKCGTYRQTKAFSED